MQLDLLSHLDVAEVGDDIAVRMCGRILSDLGANVVHISSTPSDVRDRARVTAPEWLDWYLDHGKATLEDNPAEVAQFLRDRADFVVGDQYSFKTGGSLEAIARDAASGQSKAIAVALTPFGLDGPDAEYTALPLTVFHAGGEAYLLPGGAMYRQRPPTQPTGIVGAYDVAVAGATGGIAALLGRRRSGHGSLVEISGQEVVLSLNRSVLAHYAVNGVVQHRYERGYAVGGIMRCSDGWVAVMAVTEDHQWRAFTKLLGVPEMGEDPRYATRAARTENGVEADNILTDIFSQWRSEELMVKCQEEHIPVAKFLTLEEALLWDQHSFRQFLTEENGPYGKVRTPGFPAHFTFSKGESSENGSTEEVQAGPRVSPSEGLFDGDPELPLSGIRILDFSWQLAGPYGTMLLGLLGAEVIKIESQKRPDLSRRMYPMKDAIPADLDSGSGYVSVNMNKFSLALDLRSTEGLDIAQRIAAVSDAVIDNFSPGVMERMGLGPEQLLDRRSDLVCVSESTSGSSGPRRHYVGYAALFNALSGMGHLLGFPDCPPGEMRTGADLRVGAMTALATVAALEHRDQCKRGVFVDLSAVEVLMGAVGDEVTRSQFPGQEAPVRSGNHFPIAYPHNCYPCRGEDSWICISVPDDDTWRKLAHLLEVDGESWATDPKFGDTGYRRDKEDDIDQMIATWTSSQDSWTLTALLQEIGVAAYPSANTHELATNGHLLARGAWQVKNHPRFGPVKVLSSPIRVNGVSSHIWTVGALLGEHTGLVLKRLLGYDDDEVRTLFESGVTQ
ncbi:MAG: CoA transferase [Acidimicrobiales bacterium]|jgi:crotonobetainyl-CoA:carnitine CoA-transferase CaiB-like acyl-CoA transferase